MKKLIALFFSLALLIACSSDDDNNDDQGVDPIIGTWILVDASAPLDTHFCLEEESTMTFNTNNTGQATFYLGEDCEENGAPGSWENNGNSRYTITVPVLGSLQGDANFTSNNRFTFTTAIVGISGTLTFEKQ